MLVQISNVSYSSKVGRRPGEDRLIYGGEAEEVSVGD